MVVLDLRFEPVLSVGDNEIVIRAKQALIKEFGELYEFEVLGCD